MQHAQTISQKNTSLISMPNGLAQKSKATHLVDNRTSTLQRKTKNNPGLAVASDAPVQAFGWRSLGRLNPRRYIPEAIGGYSAAVMAGEPAGGPLDTLGLLNPRLYLPSVLGGHTLAQMNEPHHAPLYTTEQRRRQEAVEALAFNGGRPRRNSIAQAELIHGLTAGGGGPMTRAGLEALRADGHMSAAAIAAMIPAGTEEPWIPHLGGGRAQIRTGRNWRVPDGGGGHFVVRMHTNDHHAPVGSHAANNAIVRIQHGRDFLLDQPTRHPIDARVNGGLPMDWSRHAAMADGAHVPLVR